MALNTQSLGSELEAAVRASLTLGAIPYPQLTAFCHALAQAVVDHIKANAVLVATANTNDVNGNYPAQVTGGVI
jgi:hypothetical protein